MKNRSGFSVLALFMFAASPALHAQAPTMSVKITSPAPGSHFDSCTDIPPGYYVLVAKLTAKTGETVFSDPVPITVGNADKGNILMNREFDCKTTPWILYVSSEAEATWAIDPTAEIASGGAAVVHIVTGGPATWDVALSQPLQVDSGHTYTFSFTAQSTESSKTIDLFLQMTHDPWTIYYLINPNIESLQDYGPYQWECTSLNYPNPFNPSTTIQYQVPEEAEVTLTLYNLRGQAIRTLVKKSQKPGDHAAVWSGVDDAGERVPSGVYIVRLKAKASGGTALF